MAAYGITDVVASFGLGKLSDFTGEWLMRVTSCCTCPLSWRDVRALRSAAHVHPRRNRASLRARGAHGLPCECVVTWKRTHSHTHELSRATPPAVCPTSQVPALHGDPTLRAWAMLVAAASLWGTAQAPIHARCHTAI